MKATFLETHPKAMIVARFDVGGIIGIVKRYDLMPCKETLELLKGFSTSHVWYCAYVGLPSNHNLAKLTDREMDDQIEVHGGITFTGELNGISWFGWDYNHYGDRGVGESQVKDDLVDAICVLMNK